MEMLQWIFAIVETFSQWYSVKMKSKKLNKNILIKAFGELGFISKNIEVLPHGTGLDFFDEIGFYVYLTDAGNYPYNSWITIFEDEEFVFERTLEFRFDKFYEYWEKRYSIMLTIVFELILNLGEEAIYINSIDDEIYLFKGNGEILLNIENRIWDNICFKDIILK